MNKEVEIGSLKVKTVGSGANKVRVVLLPDHEFSVEHFLPENLQNEGRVSPRVSRVKSNLNSVKFMAKTGIMGGNPLNEARLALFVGRLVRENQLQGVKVERPLAVALGRSIRPMVFYRHIDSSGVNYKESSIEAKKREAAFTKLHDILWSYGITPRDFQTIRGTDRHFHVIDFESWKLTPKARKRILGGGTMG